MVFRRILAGDESVGLLRVHNDHMRPAGNRFRPLHGVVNLSEIMPVDPLHMPTESQPPGIDVIHTDDVFRQPIKLEPIKIRKGDQIVQFPLGGGLRRFPNFAFLAFPVADDGKRPGVDLFDFSARGRCLLQR